ncbi:hypothetical protein BDY17DRAFT_34670 [Neohortaea acidophila]|uniref:Uncharacterized protein n=1 Tax=Neohortaea acidophila TaxID=245834 RepID=A0A6A6PJX9_9PEZI|nr:uncharacterized protein BDY17DRAFT_34670 [Neohortaea acidophila]KAF2480235.1 hypothetical protein BDY17DRAFT_34670 [Neohortaea acidophila]
MEEVQYQEKWKQTDRFALNAGRNSSDFDTVLVHSCCSWTLECINSVLEQIIGSARSTRKRLRVNFELRLIAPVISSREHAARCRSCISFLARARIKSPRGLWFLQCHEIVLKSSQPIQAPLRSEHVRCGTKPPRVGGMLRLQRVLGVLADKNPR